MFRPVLLFWMRIYSGRGMPFAQTHMTHSVSLTLTFKLQTSGHDGVLTYCAEDLDVVMPVGQRLGHICVFVTQFWYGYKTAIEITYCQVW